MRRRDSWVVVGWLVCLAAVGVLRPVAARYQTEEEAAGAQEAGPDAPTDEPAQVDPPAEDGATTEGDPPSSEPDPVDAEPEEDSEDGEPDSDLPGRLLISTDSECNVFVDGQLEGRAKPDERLEIAVKLGELELRATSVEAPGATWEKTVDLTDVEVEAVRVRMKRAIRQFRREERQSGVYRDSKTLLMWPKRDNGRDVDLRKAYAYCRDLQTGGFEDWRLPTLEQLRSIEALWERSTYKIRGDIVLSECCIWSSDYDGSERAATFDYRFRQTFQTNAGYEIGLRALCVRDWDPEAEPQEAQAEDSED